MLTPGTEACWCDEVRTSAFEFEVIGFGSVTVMRFLARQDLFAVEVAAVGDDIEARRFQRYLRLLGHVRELRPIGPDVAHFMRDDQMMLGVDGDLDIVAHDTGTSAARCHRAGIRIGQRCLLVRRGEHSEGRIYPVEQHATPHICRGA